MGNTVYDFKPSEASNSTTGGVNTAEGQGASTLNDALRAQKQLIAKWLDDLAGVNTVTGSATAIAVATAQVFTAYGDAPGQIDNGTVLVIKMAAAATGAATVAVDGLTAKKVRRQGDTAIQANDWVAKGYLILRFDTAYDAGFGAGAWVLLNAAVPDLVSLYLALAGGQVVTGGFRVTPYDNGAKSSGTFTPDAYNGNYQRVLNAGAFTLGMPANDCAIDLLIQNGVAPGSITFDAGARVGASTGDAYATAARASATCTISNANPGVVTWNSHGLKNGDPVFFTTSGGLPTGLTASTIYFAKNVTTNTFEVAATPGGASIGTSSAGSGTHTATAPSQFLVSIRRMLGVGTYIIKALQ